MHTRPAAIVDIYLYIIDLADELLFNAKLFADEASLFFMVRNVNTSVNKVNDMHKSRKWAHQWKASLNPDPSHQ